MKRLIVVLMFMFAATITAAAQDWSEYSRGSDAWKRINRGAMTRPWKYDRAGRLRRGGRYYASRSSAGRRVRSYRPRRRR
ncbi:MAG: hypothetical protein M3384_11060 [Acidobacteriota bacterium]|nr:hypothetical protein [Acidobacteriota bacterium]